MSSLAQELWDAAWDGDLKRMETCLGRGAGVNARPNGSSALEAAAYHGKAEACEFLLERGADADACHEPTGETVLHQAITKRDAERTRIVELLVAAGAEVNRRTVPGVVTQSFARDIRTRGETPLHRAAAYGDVEMIRILVSAGADKAARDAHGESPLTWASWHLRENDVLRLLLHGGFEGSLP
ncbi:ankyrin repeat domain-containing protein [Luteolibacter yonseiensis]|uniref:Ankyrin repeat domain-containing protein n=1 Tax=Luteolibacter yonseiensis TaxID=1144680 RepID=A0A934VCF8_9BACT|nr:ankyrin repeat domain-containing protein [Luteolibacter yonseiensis]MBK1816921.1 ankyrin repeat domain-containing protein [Luteolibacter yonseiensis]